MVKERNVDSRYHNLVTVPPRYPDRDFTGNRRTGAPYDTKKT